MEAEDSRKGGTELEKQGGRGTVKKLENLVSKKDGDHQLERGERDRKI